MPRVAANHFACSGIVDVDTASVVPSFLVTPVHSWKAVGGRGGKSTGFEGQTDTCVQIPAVPLPKEPIREGFG